MKSEYFPPTFHQTSFHCPHCNVKAKQDWMITYYPSGTGGSAVNNDLLICKCTHCCEIAYWYKEKMIIPLSSNAPMPHSDLPESIGNDYLEARNIVNASPRGAAALLRLCLQKLMAELGETGKDINKDIGSLVQKGLPQEVQQALDIVRVIGNESVHPGEFDLQDDQDTAIQMFELINFIVEDQITRKKKISTLFSRLPKSKLDGIEARDKK